MEGEPRERRIASMFQRAMGRPITEAESEAARGFVEELALEKGVATQDIDSDARLWQDFAQSLFCMKEFIYVE